MIIFAPKTVEWTSDDASHLKDFLDSTTGVRLLQVLAVAAPELLDGAHKNKALVAMGAVAGFQEALNTIFRLTHEDPNQPLVPPTASDNYKSLDDDSAWVEEDKQVDKTPNSTTS